MAAHPLRASLWTVAVVGILGAAYLGLVAGQVVLGSADDPPGHAGAIVVLGAAQYDGEPSPTLAARLEHAYRLWNDDVAPLIVVTGGQRPGDRFNEATAGRTWLHQRGVPDDVIRREVQGRNTYEQLAATTRFLRAEGVQEVVLVSDPLHATRLRLIADEVGLDAAVSSTRSSASSWRGATRTAAREISAVAAGQVIGFRRLRNLTVDDETAVGSGEPPGDGQPEG